MKFLQLLKLYRTSDYEFDGTITVAVVNREGYVADESANSVNVAVVDDDLPFGVSIMTKQEYLIEGSDAIFLVKTQPPATEQFSVQLQFTQGDADIFPTDTSLIPTSVTFEVGESTKEVQVPTVADEIDEEWAIITANLIASSSLQHPITDFYNITSTSVRDDDPPTISIVSVAGELNGQPSDDEGTTFNFVIESSSIIHSPLTINPRSFSNLEIL